MNSGCYENDISKILLSIQVIDKNDLTEKEIKKEDINFYIEEPIYQRFNYYFS